MHRDISICLYSLISFIFSFPITLTNSGIATSLMGSTCSNVKITRRASQAFKLRAGTSRDIASNLVKRSLCPLWRILNSWDLGCVHKIKTVFDLAENTGRKISLYMPQNCVWSYTTELWLLQSLCLRSSSRESFKQYPALAMVMIVFWDQGMTTASKQHYCTNCRGNRSCFRGSGGQGDCQVSVGLRSSFPTERRDGLSVRSQHFADILMNLVSVS